MSAPGADVPPPAPGACLFCQKPVKARSKICDSNKCRNRQINEAARRKRVPKDRAHYCKLCATRLPERQMGVWTRKAFCSKVCTVRWSARAAHQRGLLQKWGALKPGTEKCLYEPCNKKFLPGRTVWGTKLYCSARCKYRSAKAVRAPRTECEMCEAPLKLCVKRVDRKVCSSRCLKDRALLRRRIKPKWIDRARAVENMIRFASCVVSRSKTATLGGSWNVYGDSSQANDRVRP